ncbi:hypothetical protein V8G54_009240 [Vigna mungo]|uniref:Uncharacterized protein n=1 Tax=Vigna mungo TaxID=3915 RepID=A0AAQ3NVF2_VIGMU
MTKMPTTHFFPNFIFRPKILTIPKALIQRLFRRHRSRSFFLRDRPLFRRLCVPEPLRQRRPYVLSRRGRRERPPEKSPRRASGWGRRHTATVWVWTGPGTRPRRRSLHRQRRERDVSGSSHRDSGADCGSLCRCNLIFRREIGLAVALTHVDVNTSEGLTQRKVGRFWSDEKTIKRGNLSQVERE